MNRILNIVLIIIIAASLVAIGIAFLQKPTEEVDSGVKVVEAPEQSKAQRPPCFPDPEANYIPMPETTNLAQGKPVLSGEHTDVYVDSNVNDGKTDTYWESKGFPAEMVIELEGSYKISTVAVRLNPSAIWEARTQEIAVQVSTDGGSYKEIVPATRYGFDPETGNRIRIDFDTTEASYVKLIFTMNSSSRTGGAQAAEIEVYE
ncbi:MAG: discoidin domain-containing protein [Clostridia bacterium]|nr:discoidin domain-containing protein [Clostridia bacterium]